MVYLSSSSKSLLEMRKYILEMNFFTIIFICLYFSRTKAYNFTCSQNQQIATVRNFGKWKWPNGIVKYELHSSLTASDIIEVNKAIAVYHQKTCIRFQTRSSGESAYVSIENDPTTCGVAHVCRTGGYQYARFGGSCRTAPVMVHELGHTLCFGHEQSREDRNNYLNFPCDDGGGIDKGFDTLGLFYDYKSSMHYGCNNCMIPKMADVSTSMCGQDNLSVLDVEKINAFYDCSGCLGYRFRPISTLTQAEKQDLLPAGSSIGGEVLYVCRAYQNGDIIPGTGNVNTRTCFVSMGTVEHRHGDAEFLTRGKADTRLVWLQKPSNKVIPSNAIPGGRTRFGETLYIARATLTSGGQRSTVIGKVHANQPDIAWIPLDGKEHAVSSFEFLKCNN